MARFVPTLIFLFLMIIAKTRPEEIVNPVVTTTHGRVMGHFMQSYENKTCIAFEGIPFAAPPVGKLRFEEPQPPNPWSDVLVANKTYTCSQSFMGTLMGEEDCLYVYVYVPMDKITGNENLHVVAHIHGGAFQKGSPTIYLGPKYLLDTNIIYVSFNYRLGVFGFLSTQDDVVPGNNALKDQTLALKWIKDNIKQFGGNPNSVTIMGLSAGAVSVHLHYFSPLSTGLFHRGISQSGCALLSWSMEKDPLRSAKKLGQHFNCSTNSSDIMVECLRNLTDTDILYKIDEVVIGLGPDSVTFGPVIENGKKPFLPDHPYKLLVLGKFNDVPWLASNVKEEGAYLSRTIIQQNMLDYISEHWIESLPQLLTLNPAIDEKNKAMIVAKITDHYFQNKTLSMDNVQQLAKLQSDRMYFYDTETALRLQAKKAKCPVYYYWFEYLLEKDENVTVTVPGPTHTDDGRLIYNMNIFGAEHLPEGDRRMKNILADFLFEFVSSEKPKMKGVEFERVTHRDLNYMHVRSPDDIQMKVMTELTPREFWDQLPLEENAWLFKDLTLNVED